VLAYSHLNFDQKQEFTDASQNTELGISEGALSGGIDWTHRFNQNFDISFSLFLGLLPMKGSVTGTVTTTSVPTMRYLSVGGKIDYLITIKDIMVKVGLGYTSVSFFVTPSSDGGLDFLGVIPITLGLQVPIKQYDLGVKLRVGAALNGFSLISATGNLGFDLSFGKGKLGGLLSYDSVSVTVPVVSGEENSVYTNTMFTIGPYLRF
jgi:hypothetical protein